MGLELLCSYIRSRRATTCHVLFREDVLLLELYLSISLSLLSLRIIIYIVKLSTLRENLGRKVGVSSEYEVRDEEIKLVGK